MGYQYTITILNDTRQWHVEYENKEHLIDENADNISNLEAYRTLIRWMAQQTLEMTLQAIFIVLFIITSVILCLYNPALLKHPFVLIVSFTCVFILYSLFTNLDSLRENNANVRYYHLLLTQ